MAWPGQQPAAAAPGGDAAQSRFAVPAPCPRCELTKSQMNRTIQNYQKAYRKKVEGLKTELSTVRADNTQLKKQAQRLRRKRWVHVPSMVVGAAAAAAASWLWRRLKAQQHAAASQHTDHTAEQDDS